MFRVRSWNNGVRCMSFHTLMNVLLYCSHRSSYSYDLFIKMSHTLKGLKKWSSDFNVHFVAYAKMTLAYKQLELHGCILNAIVTDGLVLKHQAISIQIAEWINCIGPASWINVTVHFAKKTPSSLIARFMGPTWGPPGSCRHHVGLMNLAIWVVSEINRARSPWPSSQQYSKLCVAGFFEYCGDTILNSNKLRKSYV